MFTSTQGNISISGGSFTLNNAPPQSATELIVGAFREYYTYSATHDNNDILDPPKCHPGTRISFLHRLSNWVKDTRSPVYMTWLHGPAGAGKSAIARSLAEILQAEGLLAGSFFFSHMDPKRNSEKPLVATLAQQLAFSIPATQRYIADSVIRDPAIFSRSLQTQFQKLIANPIIQLTSASPRPPSLQPALMIIDGLDECKDPKARRLILSTISNAFPRLQGWLKFLIASRPEHDIQACFQTTTKTMGERINLIDILPDMRAHEDVYIYLCDQFERIKREHPLRTTINLNWPTQRQIHLLVEKSSGHFIYASTVIKYIENAYDRPQKCLDDIITLRRCSVNPFAELDALYLNILSSARVDQRLLVNILSATLVCASMDDLYFRDIGRAPLHTAKLDRFVESVLLLESGDVQLALLDLKSLIGLGESLFIPPSRSNGIPGQNTSIGLSYPDIRRIEFWHKSFSDFLLDSTRSKEFHVRSELAHTTVARGCLRVLSDNAKMSEKYWPEAEQRFWLKGTYHHALAQCCVHAAYESHLHEAMLKYNLLDILRISSFENQLEEFRYKYRSGTHYFLLLGEIIRFFQTAHAFKATNINDHLLHQLHQQLRSELKVCAPPGSRLMNALKGAIKPIGIDWPSLGTLVDTKGLPFQEVITLSSLREWPHFLEWLLEDAFLLRHLRYGPLELLICEFFCSNDWSDHEPFVECNL